MKLFPYASERSRPPRRIVLGVLVAVALATSFTPDAHAARARAAVEVGTDPSGDWGCALDCHLTLVGNELGQDLIGASLQMADRQTLNFRIKVAKLPSVGGIPEGSRYSWVFAVDGEVLELTGAFTGYLRGTCNPIHQNCPMPRDPGAAPFFIRRSAPTVAMVVHPTDELGLVHAGFDPRNATITIPVPLAMIGAKRGSIISAPWANSIASMPAAYFAAPSDMAADDQMTVTEIFVVSR